MAIYPNGFITLRKISDMISDSKNWMVFVRDNENKQILIHNEDELRKYLLDKNYSLGYDFIGDWEKYTEYKPKTNCSFSWRYDDFEISFSVEEDKIPSVHLIKWENNKEDSEDSRSCFTLAYWDYNDGWDLKFVGNRMFEYIKPYQVEKIWSALKSCQNFLDGLAIE